MMFAPTSKLCPRLKSDAVGWLAIVLLLATGSVLKSEEPARFMTYNIRYLNNSDGQDVWSNRSTTVINTLRSADVVGLQEVVHKQFQLIETETKEDFDWYGRGRDDGEEMGEMTAIGWRRQVFDCEDRGTFWLSPTPESVGKKGWDAALPRIASWVKLSRKSDGANLLVVNTHFDHQGREARRQSARLLRNWIADHRDTMPAVLMGDLNAQRSDAPLTELLEAPEIDAPKLIDAIEVSAKTPTGPNSTWNGFSEISDGRRIDHILLSGDLKVMEYTTLDPRTASDRFASDHLPVMATIAW